MRESAAAPTPATRLERIAQLVGISAVSKIFSGRRSANTEVHLTREAVRGIATASAEVALEVDRANSPAQPANAERSPEGARVFARQEERDLRVSESSLKVNGPCAWIFAGLGRSQTEAVHLTARDAETVIAGLRQFLREAEAGLLDEPFNPLR